MNSRKKILFIAAAPVTHKKTDWEQEYKEISRILNKSSLGKKYFLKNIPRATAKDVIDLLEPNCWIVHISAHGNSCGDIILETDAGDAFVPRRRNLLATLYEKTQSKCFIFNSCDSMELAQSATKLVEYAIGINGKISNEAAIEFVRNFYRAFSDYETIPMAFKVAKSDADFLKLSEIEIFIYYKNSQLMNAILQGKQEEIQNLQIQSESLRIEIEDLQKDIKRAEEQGKSGVFTDLMAKSQFPKEVFWFVENKEQLANQIGNKVFWDKSEEERRHFSTDLYAVFQILDAYLVTRNLMIYTKEDIAGSSQYPESTVSQALAELPHLVPEVYRTDEFMAYFQDHIKYLRKMLY